MHKNLFLLFLLAIVSTCYADNNLEHWSLSALNIESPAKPLIIKVTYGITSKIIVTKRGRGSQMDGAIVSAIGNPNLKPATLIIENDNDYTIDISYLNIPRDVIITTIGPVVLSSSDIRYNEFDVQWDLPPPHGSGSVASKPNPLRIGSNLVLENVVLKLIPKQQDTSLRILKNTELPEVVCDGACVWHNVQIKYPNGTIVQCNQSVDRYCKAF